MSNPLKHPKVELLGASMLVPPTRKMPAPTPDRQVSLIAASIQKFGFLAPLIIDDDNMVASGHGRLEAALKLDLETVPVIRASFLTDADRRAFALADNKLAELSSWKDDVVAEELEHLFEAGFDISLTGFTTSDLDFAIVNETESRKPSEAEHVENSCARCERGSRRIGDLWLCGPHRAYCGDLPPDRDLGGGVGRGLCDPHLRRRPLQHPDPGFRVRQRSSSAP